MDYEELILQMQESEEDNCASCPYKGGKCRNQCEREEVVYNPYLQ